MAARMIFGISVLMSFVSSAVVGKLYLWSWLRTRDRQRGLVSLLVPHMFLRFIGLSFLVHGVVSPSLPAGFAVPAAYGGLVAGILAIMAVIALAKSTPWAIPAVWVFNIWGTVDLLFGFYEGAHTRLRPDLLGAAFYLPTAIVPPLLVTHFLIFALPIRGTKKSNSGNPGI